MLRYLTAGESHGPALTVILEGVPAGLVLPAEAIRRDLARRQGGYGRGGRMKLERDDVRFTGGVRGGVTLGSPLCLVIENLDWANWSAVMDPGPGARLEERTLTRPRPGHADLAGGMKYHQRDLRNILERSSARETAARVAAGAVARLLLREAGIEVASHVLSIGEVRVVGEPSREEILAAMGSPVYCAREEEGRQMQESIQRARTEGDSLGGVFEVLAWGVPPGLGSHVQWDRRLDGLLAQALMSIPAIKGVEVGAGFAAAALPGSRVHDEIFFEGGKGFLRRTNRAGGLEGGITNGETLVVRAAMKPIPTLRKPLQSVDILTLQPEAAGVERSDVCAVPAASVVGEAAVSFTLAAALLEKFGGDHLEETLANLAAYRRYLGEVWHGGT